MKLGQIFREISQAMGRPVDEVRYKLNDSHDPTLVNLEIPDHLVEEVRAQCMIIARDVDERVKQVGFKKACEELNKELEKN